MTNCHIFGNMIHNQVLSSKKVNISYCISLPNRLIYFAFDGMTSTPLYDIIRYCYRRSNEYDSNHYRVFWLVFCYQYWIIVACIYYTYFYENLGRQNPWQDV